ncbi:ABC transporter permease [Roseivirga sp.]|uniref:ABC transporter permease n=1 Tax=Roseivirga sp. TaxID=1964215 RepID=UPI002B27469F|nr:FtsX-like permease family protein [Roseivirga sp.]
MIKQTFKFALRSFRKSGSIHLINLLGLTLGLSVFFLVSLFIYQERSYESDFTHKDRIYQLSHTMLGHRTALGAPNLPYVLDEIPEVETFTSFKRSASANLAWDDQEQIVKMLRVDSSFLEVFDFELLKGDPETVLDEPNFAVINEKWAKDFFGSTNVIGKLVKVTMHDLVKDSTYQVPVIINGVIKSPKFKTQLQFDLLVSEQRPSTMRQDVGGWQNSTVYNYIVAASDATEQLLDKRLSDISYKYVYPKTVIGGHGSKEDWKAEGLYSDSYAESLATLRTNSDTRGNLMPTLNTSQVNTLIIIALAALIISVFNFINISTARASLRMKEVGVKRIMGSSKRMLIFQFMLESFLLILLSSVVALAMVEVLVKLKPESIGIVVDYSVLHSQEWVFGLIAFILVLTFLAGIYPAIYLSSGKLVSILKSGVSKHSFSVLNAGALRRFATVLQFMCSIGLITAVITMFLQVDFLRTRDIGYQSRGVLVIDNTSLLKESKEAFAHELSRLSSISGAAYATRLPSSITLEGAQPIPINDSTKMSFSIFGVDTAFFEVMDMKFVHGHSFFESTSSDSTEISPEYVPVVINEIAAKQLGFENPIGQFIGERAKVVGVVQDFVFSDLRETIEPVLMTSRPGRGRSYAFSHPLVVKSSVSKPKIDELQEVWSRFSQEEMKWHFLETNYSNLLKVEMQGFKAVLIFSIVAVVISCLGLLGLSIFIIDQRTHEFGVRKVLGASVTDIMKLFGSGFAKLMLVAFLFALPVSVYLMQKWLSDYANRINLDAWIFVLTAVIMIIIVAATILFQSLKAGRLNPVDTLRNE